MTLSRRQLLGRTARLATAAAFLAACDDGSAPAPRAEGPDALEVFEPDEGDGKRTGLPDRVAWASTADSEFFLALSEGMRQAARERGVEYLTATSGNDPGKHVEQMSSFVDRGVGALAMQPLNPDADSVALRRAIDRGVCVEGIITAPSTLQVAASQYRIGYDQGKAAADYVVAELGGEAQVLYFNLDSAGPQLQLRHKGVLDGLRTGGEGVRVVRDVTVAEISTDSGFRTMTSALQAHPGINVVLGGDTIVLGAHAALKESGKLRDDMFLSGVDGDRSAQALVKAGGAYKLSIAFAWQLMGYALGSFGADWIAGRAVPRMMVAEGVKLDGAAAVTAFQTANADPRSAFDDPARREAYLRLLGSVSHATRTTYWTEPVDPPGSEAEPSATPTS
jgi:ribose transport system substrate-binding protein